MQVAETTRPFSSNEITTTNERSTTTGMTQVVSEEKYNLLKRQLREITERNELLVNDLSRAKKRLRRLAKEKNILLDKLCQYDTHARFTHKKISHSIAPTSTAASTAVAMEIDDMETNVADNGIMMDKVTSSPPPQLAHPPTPWQPPPAAQSHVSTTTHLTQPPLPPPQPQQQPSSLLSSSSSPPSTITTTTTTTNRIDSSPPPPQSLPQPQQPPPTQSMHSISSILSPQPTSSSPPRSISDPSTASSSSSQGSTSPAGVTATTTATGTTAGIPSATMQSGMGGPKVEIMYQDGRMVPSSRPKRMRRGPVEPKMRRVQPLEKDPVSGEYKLPARVGILTVHSLGRVVPLPTYHNDRYIWPPGFKVSRTYLSMVDPSANTVYTCSVEENGEQGPRFRVVADDCPDQPIIANSATGVWTAIVKRANEIRNREHSNSASGPDYYGFTHATIAKMIQDLPGTENCINYVWQQFGEMHQRTAAGVAAAAEKKKINLQMMGSANKRAPPSAAASGDGSSSNGSSSPPGPDTVANHASLPSLAESTPMDTASTTTSTPTTTTTSSSTALSVDMLTTPTPVDHRHHHHHHHATTPEPPVANVQALEPVPENHA
ncbi:hypothetical protein O0I10_003790 [Lichtheimia ornata]|uniref:INO80 complex subunit F domain-containing protein n=1 Tax=Lichtheimia ornata TaxID=688661 RepID=A0AAD7V6Q2_9FUNG|nr:uncharacterized protein O0I10_003790 [Lichtheimia ornata]KAJ8660333.1 hypothetical protein O0I10_003790 [Lichtheimia ornata]